MAIDMVAHILAIKADTSEFIRSPSPGLGRYSNSQFKTLVPCKGVVKA